MTAFILAILLLGVGIYAIESTIYFRNKKYLSLDSWNHLMEPVRVERFTAPVVSIERKLQIDSFGLSMMHDEVMKQKLISRQLAQVKKALLYEVDEAGMIEVRKISNEYDYNEIYQLTLRVVNINQWRKEN